MFSQEIANRNRIGTMDFIYETHLHTEGVSACASASADSYIDYMKSLGYSGIIVTDHFFTGNCAIPRNLPWEERVRRYCSGYEKALEASKGTDFTVMFGVEYFFQGDEFLLYGVDKAWLLDNPDIEAQDRFEVYRRVHQAGGIMIQAHPYRERGYLSAIHLTPDVCDGIEVYNAANPDYQNALGYQYAVEHGFRMTAGSDIHNFTLEDMGGMRFSHPIRSIEEFVAAFNADEGEPVYKRDIHSSFVEFRPVSADTALTETTQQPELEVIWH